MNDTPVAIMTVLTVILGSVSVPLANIYCIWMMKYVLEAVCLMALASVYVAYVVYDDIWRILVYSCLIIAYAIAVVYGYRKKI